MPIDLTQQVLTSHVKIYIFTPLQEKPLYNGGKDEYVPGDGIFPISGVLSNGRTVILSDLVSDVMGELERFQGEESLKRIFWEILSWTPRHGAFLLNGIPAGTMEKLDKVELFADHDTMVIFRCTTRKTLSYEEASALFRIMKRTFSRCAVLYHDVLNRLWQMVYLDDSNGLNFRFLKIPGKKEDRLRTAAAMTAFASYAPSQDLILSRLQILEHIDLFFPGPLRHYSFTNTYIDTLSKSTADVVSLNAYLRSISTYCLLTVPQQLGRDLNRYPEMTQCVCQQERLVEHNLQFVVSVARKYSSMGLDLCDLIQEGNEGLIQASTRFDASYNCHFITYAVWWIRQRIWVALANQTGIFRFPQNTFDSLYKKFVKNKSEGERDTFIRFMFSRFQEKAHQNVNLDVLLNLEGDDDEVYEYQHEENLTKLYENKRRKESLMINIPSTEPPDKEAVEKELKLTVHRVIETLKPREATVVRLYYGLDNNEPLKLEKIGNKLNLTRERIRQILVLSLRRLRHSSRSKMLRPFYYEDFDKKPLASKKRKSKHAEPRYN